METCDRVHVSSGPPGSRCQDGVRSARDILRVMPVKDEEREKKWVGKASDHTAGLTSVKGEEEGRMIT